ncbi:hypothetical protein Pcinc_000240 [Petrolisthes cinctipes]|uniref:Receptor ligand binding region domain-containing protein n=1 Tax=Petrolisthes cinctipes TaxID=88211 RepID=A0AAE1GMJ7_PETCI|nr:hypothetical protein Pcinc_000240 [Petrolisthes cinctipes]
MEPTILSSLLLFLLRPSQDTEVVIIHDYTSGVKELVESLSERWAATTILTATPAPDLSQLLVALTSFHTNDLRYMVLLCSANTTRTVFDMVSHHNLESRRVRWLMVWEKPTLAVTNLLYSMREGSMVVEHNTAFISGMVGTEIYAIINGRHLYHLSRNTFNPQPYGIVCPSGAPYTPILNLMLGRMVHAGLVSKWHMDEVNKIKQNAGQKEGTYVGQGRVGVRPLALDHLQGAFYILGCGALLATNVLFTEALTLLV